MRLLAAALLAVTAHTASAQAPKAIDRAVAAWAKVKSLSGTLEQTVTNTLMRSTAVAKATFAQQQPNKLAVRFTDPAGDAIVADGAHLWVFLQQAAPGQVL